MDRETLVALGLEARIVEEVIKLHGKATQNLRKDKARLEGEIVVLGGDKARLEGEIVTLSGRISELEVNSKANEEAAALRVKAGEDGAALGVKATEDGAASHVKANEDEVAQATLARERAESVAFAKNEALGNAILAFEHRELGKLNPKQADLLVGAFGAKAEYAEQDGVFSVTNLDVIMGEAVTHGGFDFARAQTRNAPTGGLVRTVPIVAQGRSMNDFIRAGN
ncbi:MAG: hypothetical protein FWG87_12005 [Defluviitaleaceae bacterium]|nr:hypothetical protein [Defluviitaleaceae bacterium]